MIRAEARHVQGVRDVAAGLVRQGLDLRGRVVVRHEHRVAGLEQLANACPQGIGLTGAQGLVRAEGLGPQVCAGACRLGVVHRQSSPHRDAPGVT